MLIKDENEKPIALVYRRSLLDEPPKKDSIEFISEPDHFVQVGLWHSYSKDHKILTHKHNPSQRVSTITHEMFYVESGSILVWIYDDELQALDKVILTKGDILVQLAGAHGFEVLEDGTTVIEAKNGPFQGTAADKTRVELPKW